MADEEHLKILRKGVDRWNQWRRENPRTIPDLSEEDFSGLFLAEINFTSVNLNRTRFVDANLRNGKFVASDLRKAVFVKTNLLKADFRQAKLNGANLSASMLEETDFSEADLDGAWFIQADLRNSILRDANLTKAVFQQANLQDCDFRPYSLDETGITKLWISNEKLWISSKFVQENFSEANFYQANLKEATFKEADLTNAFFRNANLSGVDLRGANLRGANLTGACIEGRNIDSATTLDGVHCDYIYLKSGEQERCPSDISQNFAPGEFAKLFEEIANAVELVFYKGINWRAFAFAFNESNTRIYDEYGEEIFFQEYKVLDNGFLVLKIRFPQEADRRNVREILEQKYEMQLQIARLEGEVKAKDSALEMAFQRLLLAPSLQVNIKQMIGDNNQMAGDRHINTGGGSYYESINTEGGNYIQGNYINMSQDLSQAAQQIQELLQQLQNQGMTQEAAQQEVAKDMATQAKNDPSFRGKLATWGKSLGDAAAKTTVTEAVKYVITAAMTSLL